MSGAIQASPTAYPAPALPQVTDRSVSYTAIFPDDAYVVLELVGTGELKTRTPEVTTDHSPEWSRIPVTEEEWQARLTVVSGSAPTFGSYGSWGTLPLDAIKFWELDRTTLGVSTGVWKVEWRYGENSPVLASALYTMTAAQTAP